MTRDQSVLTATRGVGRGTKAGTHEKWSFLFQKLKKNNAVDILGQERGVLMSQGVQLRVKMKERKKSEEIL